jgi:hypothetical protein
VTVRGRVLDPDDRPVELTDERWSHIVERHPEIQGYEDEVLRAVRDPDVQVPAVSRTKRGIT